MYQEVKCAKPWVLVGISPFGIWRPGHPEGITGFDQYEGLYADARKWLQAGWVDYFTPQLYWKIDSDGQSYPKLLDWWSKQNASVRHLWPGNYTSRTARTGDSQWDAREILNQIAVTRAQPGAGGNVHFSMKALMGENNHLAEELKRGPYREPAVIPESAWLDGETPAAPVVSIKAGASARLLTFELPDNATLWQWVLKVKSGDDWRVHVLSGRQSRHELPVQTSRAIVAAVSRLGRIGASTTIDVDRQAR